MRRSQGDDDQPDELNDKVSDFVARLILRADSPELLTQFLESQSEVEKISETHWKYTPTIVFPGI